MLLVALLIGAILVVAAFRNTQGVLFGALATDVPAYVIWAAALLAVGVVGYVKPLKNVSDALIVLILTVLIVNNYQAILAGVQAAAASNAGATPGAAPAADAGTSTTSADGQTATAPLGNLGSQFGSQAGDAAGNAAGNALNSQAGNIVSSVIDGGGSPFMPTGT
jgi:hypothetical protein